jgi:serine/threonine-protein kinase RsbT
LTEPVRLEIRSFTAADQARREARALALGIGFDRADAESVALAVSELATNLVRYALGGTLMLSAVDIPHHGIRVECNDAGPGIADVRRALEDGFSTGGGLGSGLPAVRRLMDDFEIDTGTSGTTIIASKWLAPR